MGKKHRSDGEYSKVQKLSHENKKLRREILQLRNQLSHNYCPECNGEVEEVAENTKEFVIVEPPKAAPKLCHICQEGVLVLIRYEKFNGEEWYFRKCPTEGCKNRTKGKKYTPDVK